MSVAAVTTSTTATSALSGGTAAELGDRFLKLLVTQLKNQDPLNPMENAEITSQMAQLSSLEGINSMNDSLAAMSAQFRASQAIQGASLIGRQVLAEGSVLNLTDAGAAGGVELAGKADRVTVDVKNAAGTVIRSLELGANDAGIVRFAWDGLDASGNTLANSAYDFAVTATAGGKSIDATALALAQVQSVSLAATGLSVELENLGGTDLAKVKQVF